MNTESIKALVISHIQDAIVSVRDMTGGGDHWEIQVVSQVFEGLNLLARHRKMHDIFKGPMEQAIHAVKFKTMTPAEYERLKQKNV